MLQRPVLQPGRPELLRNQLFTQRQFGPEGIYRACPCTSRRQPRRQPRGQHAGRPGRPVSLYGLLFSMPGVPSIYYGSEWGIEAARTVTTALRPPSPWRDKLTTRTRPPAVLHRLARCARPCRPCATGISAAGRASQQLPSPAAAGAPRGRGAERRRSGGEHRPPLTGLTGKRLEDQLNPGHTFPVQDGHARVTLDPHWARIMALQAEGLSRGAIPPRRIIGLPWSSRETAGRILLLSCRFFSGE
jgi:hypothetical protein